MAQSDLKTKIKAEITSVYGSPEDSQKLDLFCEALSKAIVDWFEQDAKSLPGTFTDSQGGAVSGTGQLQG